MAARRVCVQTQGSGHLAHRHLLLSFQMIEHPTAGLGEGDRRRAAGGGRTIFHKQKCSKFRP